MRRMIRIEINVSRKEIAEGRSSRLKRNWPTIETVYSNAQFEYRKPHEIDILQLEERFGLTVQLVIVPSTRQTRVNRLWAKRSPGRLAFLAFGPEIENHFPVFSGQVSPSTNREESCYQNLTKTTED